MPNQTMNTGMSPNSGSVREHLHERVDGVLADPAEPGGRRRAAGRCVPPTAKPIATRSSETASAPWSVPYAGESVVTSVTTVDQICVGGGSFCAETRPGVADELPDHQHGDGADEAQQGPARDVRRSQRRPWAGLACTVAAAAAPAEPGRRRRGG